jgi:hypothetical protein
MEHDDDRSIDHVAYVYIYIYIYVRACVPIRQLYSDRYVSSNRQEHATNKKYDIHDPN